MMRRSRPLLALRPTGAVLVLAAVFAASILVPPPRAFADVPGGTSGAFAGIEVGARAIGTAGTGVTLEQGAFASSWNPGNLARLERNEIAIDYTDLFGLGIARHMVVSFAWRHVPARRVVRDGRLHIEPRGNQFGFGIDVAVTTVDLEPEIYTEFAPAFSFAATPWAGMAAGATVRILRANSDFDNTSAIGYALNLGFAYELEELARGLAGWRLAAASRNLLSTIAWADDTSDRLPVDLTVGLAYRGLGNLTLVAEATGSEDHFPVQVARFGAEWSPSMPLALRGGVVIHRDRGDDRMGFTFGAGTHLAGLHFDYAYTGHMNVLDDTNRFSLRFMF